MRKDILEGLGKKTEDVISSDYFGSFKWNINVYLRVGETIHCVKKAGAAGSLEMTLHSVQLPEQLGQTMVVWHRD